MGKIISIDLYEAHVNTLNQWAVRLGATTSHLCGVYMIEAPDGKKYIGSSRNLRKRWSMYRSLSTSARQPKVFQSFIKYGAANHAFSILEICDPKELLSKEAYYGKKHDVLNDGLNDCIPKSDYYPSASIAVSRHRSETNKGKVLSPAHRAALTASVKGKKISSEILSKRTSRKGEKRSPEAKERMRIANQQNCKAIIDTKTGLKYNSVTDAAKALGIRMDTLSKKLTGRKNNNTTFQFAQQ